ncbi:MAG: twin-arginine translocase subunit TatC [bacterium]|nr:twin-arginine translocase subunit TatC [bacterium]MCP4968495.1 twin-arginine translocase subunit TatC [bacterium]
MTSRMSLMDHLVELRSRLIKSLVAVAVGSVVGFIFYRDILAVLAKPYEGATDQPLAFFQPTEPFSLALRVALFGGFIIASPVIMYQVWRFIGPALTNRERRYVYPLSAVMALLFMSGVALGYYTLPLALRVLFSFAGDLLQETVGVNFYFSFAMRFILAFGLAFQFPVFLFAAAALGLISSRALREQRRWAVVVVVVAAALMTPGGDPITLLMLSTPMYLLYEASILSIRLILKR